MKMFSFVRKPFSYTYNNVALQLILVNVVIYLLQIYFKQRGIDIQYFFGLNPELFFGKKMFWQILTYMFLHGSFLHVFFNMLAIFWFGVAIEKKMGSKEFLLFYLLCGTLAGLSMGLAYHFLGVDKISVIGASAAVYAVMFAFAVLYPDSTIYLYFVVPIPSAILIIGYFVLEFLQMFRGDGIAHLGHFFGLVFAWLYVRIRYRIKPLRVFGFIK